MNICDRWRQNKVGLATTALFNGIGMESWENVWGTWNGITPRDAQIYTRVAAILRFAGGHELGGRAQADAVSNRSLLQSSDWSPFSPPIITPSRTYASTFTSEDGSEALVTVVAFASGPCAKFVVKERFRSSNFAFFDLWHGGKIHMDASTNTVCVPVDDSVITTLGQCGSNPDATCAGFGALLITTHSADPTLGNFLDRMRKLSATKLAQYRCEGGPTCVNNGTVDTDPWPFFPTCNASVCAGLTMQAVPKVATKPHTSAPTADAIKIVGGDFLFVTSGVMIEGDTAQGVDVQFPFEPSPRKVHSGMVQVPTLWVDKYPVTNDKFAKFLAETQYKPVDSERFLQHWHQGKPRPGWGNKPVTFVSLRDARAYCTHYDQRLPEVAEWQWLAGQHAKQTAIYPWGDDPPSNQTAGGTGAGPGNVFNGPRDVDALPAGCSVAGVCDLIGNTWEMSTEFHDQHTRSVVLLGE